MKIMTQMRFKKDTHTFESEAPVLILDGSDLVWVELAGAETAIRATWANLSASASTRDATSTHYYAGGDYKRITVLETGYKQKTVEKHLVIYSREITEVARKYMLYGNANEPSPYFMEVFIATMHKIPFEESWIQKMWKMGIEEEAISPLTVFEGDGIFAWKMSDKESQWEKIIQTIIKESQ